MSTARNERLALRVRQYIGMVDDALKQVKDKCDSLPQNVREIISLASLYVRDAEYYLASGDEGTALACISYAEGLLDALNKLGYIKIKWDRRKPLKVLVGGTFDIIHPGHIHYLREAAKKGLVYAVIATDENVKRIKGKYPILNQEQRLEIISSIKYVYDAFIGDERDFIKPIERIKPDIVLLGPDQPINEEFIIKETERRGIEVVVERLPKRIGPENASTTNIVKEILRRYCKSRTS